MNNNEEVLSMEEKNILEIEKSTGITNHDKDYNMELFRRNYELIGDLLKDKGLIKKEGR